MTNFELIFKAIQPNVTENGIIKLFTHVCEEVGDITKVMKVLTSSDAIPVIDKKILLELCINKYTDDSTKVVSIEYIKFDIIENNITIRVNKEVKRYRNNNNPKDWSYSSDTIHTEEFWADDYDRHSISLEEYSNFEAKYNLPRRED